MIPRRTLLLAAPLLALGGCQRSVAVRVLGPATALRFELRSQSRNLFGFLDSLSVSSLEVIDIGHGGRCWENPMWCVHANRDGADQVERIIYGAVPTGWVETVRPKPLLENGIYSVDVSGSGSTGGASFKVVRDDVIFPDETEVRSALARCSLRSG